MDLADHCRHVAQQLVDRLELRKEAVGNETRYVSAWFDDELRNYRAPNSSPPPKTTGA